MFDPPSGHPVYNKPMPGFGCQNNSLFSFWGNQLFGRMGGVEVSDAKAVEKVKKWAKPETVSIIERRKFE